MFKFHQIVRYKNKNVAIHILNKLYGKDVLEDSYKRRGEEYVIDNISFIG